MSPYLWPPAMLILVGLLLLVVKALTILAKCNDSVVGLEEHIEDAERFQWMQTKISETHEKLDAGRPIEVTIKIEPDQVLWKGHHVNLRKLIDRARIECVENNEVEDYDKSI